MLGREVVKIKNVGEGIMSDRFFEILQTRGFVWSFSKSLPWTGGEEETLRELFSLFEPILKELDDRGRGGRGVSCLCLEGVGEGLCRCSLLSFYLSINQSSHEMGEEGEEEEVECGGNQMEEEEEEEEKVEVEEVVARERVVEMRVEGEGEFGIEESEKEVAQLLLHSNLPSLDSIALFNLSSEGGLFLLDVSISSLLPLFTTRPSLTHFSHNSNIDPSSLLSRITTRLEREREESKTDGVILLRDKNLEGMMVEDEEEIEEVSLKKKRNFSTQENDEIDALNKELNLCWKKRRTSPTKF